MHEDEIENEPSAQAHAAESGKPDLVAQAQIPHFKGKTRTYLLLAESPLAMIGVHAYPVRLQVRFKGTEAPDLPFGFQPHGEYATRSCSSLVKAFAIARLLVVGHPLFAGAARFSL